MLLLPIPLVSLPLTLHAQGLAAGGTFDWASSDENVAHVAPGGTTAEVTAVGPGNATIEVAYNCPCGQQARDSIRCLVYQVTIDNPSGDPVNSGSATNEFTFSGATPGVLTIQCRAAIAPNDADTVACASQHLRWSIDGVGNSALTWNPADPANAAQGKGATATATFTGLPANSTDFGTKTVRLLYEDGAIIATTQIEVFFPKNDTNHPNPGQGATPNWFFYWLQVIGSPAQARYGGPNPNAFGTTQAMTQWNYGPGLPDKTLVHIHDDAPNSDGAIAGLHGPLSGIDLFENTVLHETQHTRQIALADPVVGIHANTCWENGWSFNQPNHNHWQLAPGRAAGGAGICTSAGPGTMGAPGSGDVSLFAVVPSKPGYTSWPQAWGPPPAGAAPGGAFIGGTPIEQQAFQQETSPENARARQDWADPGKNHRTLDRFDD